MTDSELIEHMHARGWRTEAIDVPMIREACAALIADRDSWHQQASDRLDDALRFATERDEALAALKVARVQALAHAADLYGVGDVAAPVGNSEWGEARQGGWIDGTWAYRDAIRRLGEEAGRGES